MKKVIKNLLFLFFLISFTTPILSVIAKPNSAQSSTTSFVCGITFGAGDWDPPIYVSTPNNYYIAGCLETLVWTDKESVSHPVLATHWTVHPRPDEGGHTGGVKAITLTLRQGVQFHDGSEWNATVAKWNIDRNIAISGNQSGTGDAQNRDVFWFDPAQYDAEFTPNWNLSWYKSDPFGLGNEIPIINKTEVVSDYVINVTYNGWSTDVSGFASNYYTMISMETYGDYSGAAIYGVGEDPLFPQDNPAIFPGHFIGTGPYIFDYVDEAVTAIGHMVKNDNYWNKTALEAAGLFSITDVYIRHYVDYQSRTTALLAGEIDYSGDLSQIPIVDHDAVFADPLLDYHEYRLDPAIVDITFKSEEGLNTPVTSGLFTGLTPKYIWANYLAAQFGLPGTTIPKGINRTIRRALSYSFDYDTFHDIVQGGWGNKSQSCLGINSLYYNPSVPEPYYDVSKAQEIILNDPYYGPMAAARGLTVSNSTADWNTVAIYEPLEIHDMLYNTGSDVPTYMEAALNDIGCKFVGVGVADLWQGYVGTALAIFYDMFPFVWPQSETAPIIFLNTFYRSDNRIIPHFGYNFNFMANANIDQKFTDITFSADPQADYDFVANHIQNYDVPMLYLSQYMIGFAINVGWNFTENMPDRIGFSGLPYYAWIGGERESVPIPPPLIPGYETGLILFISISALVGIIYAMKRKNF